MGAHRPARLVRAGRAFPTPTSARWRCATGRTCRARRARSASTRPARPRACASRASSRAGASPSSGSSRRSAARGVVNRYRPAAQLGADRWALLVAARRRALGERALPRRRASRSTPARSSPSTRSTRDGVFLGGIIVPGPRLMLQAMAERAAALKVPPGSYHAVPDEHARRARDRRRRRPCAARSS